MFLFVHCAWVHIIKLPTGLTTCQMQRQWALLSGDAVLVPRCLDSGEFEPVQCDEMRNQCWCVDLEGMEIYGTRQNGRPSQCEWVYVFGPRFLQVSKCIDSL